jgi:hypothetical protein
MKKLTIILAGLLLAAIAATPAVAAIEVNGSAYVGYFDKYLWRGIDLSGGTPVVQGGVNLSTHGFTLSYWTNIQTKDDVIEYFDAPVEGGNATETDITIDYTFSPVDKVKVSVGNIWYALEGIDTKEAYLGLALDVPLAPVIKAYYDYDQSEENGLFYTAAVSHTFAPLENLSVGVGALVSYNDENWGVSEAYSDWHNYELSASATYAITDQITVTPSLLYSSPISDEAKDAIDSEWLGGLTVSMSF